ncbi:20267_t:CDS:2, partial [Racocetra persica]
VLYLAPGQEFELETSWYIVLFLASEWGFELETGNGYTINFEFSTRWDLDLRLGNNMLS